MPNCIEKFDKLAEELLKSDSSSYADIIQKAEKALEESTDEMEKTNGEIYVKIMKKIQEKRWFRHSRKVSTGGISGEIFFEY